MNCVTCKAIVNGDMKRCRACINAKAHSIAEVASEYKGWLVSDIIAKRSHNTSEAVNGTSGSANDGGGADNCCGATDCGGIQSTQA